MAAINSGRVTAELEGDFVVFRIGMRVNTLWKLHKWLPVFLAMPRMIDELEADPDSGLLGYDTNLGVRNHELVQYWRSFEDLRAYALDPDGHHVPSMQWLHREMGENADVGLWHETYLVRDGEYETTYRNMPLKGLGKAGEVLPASGRRRTAAGRLGWSEGDDVSYGEEGVESVPVEAPD